MIASSSSPLLRRAIVLDSAASGLMAVGLALGAPFLSGPLGLPADLLRGVGVILVPWVVVLAWVAARPFVPRNLALGIVASNVAWVAASAWLLLSGLVSPTAMGTAFVVAQAAAVALFADLQWMGLRQGRTAAA